jgi:hypothetical protein
MAANDSQLRVAQVAGAHHLAVSFSDPELEPCARQALFRTHISSRVRVLEIRTTAGRIKPPNG